MDVCSTIFAAADSFLVIFIRNTARPVRPSCSVLCEATPVTTKDAGLGIPTK